MAAGGPTPPASPPPPPPSSGGSRDQAQELQELIRILQNFEREVRQTIGQSASDSTSTLLQDLSYDIERFGRDFITELSTQFRREMNSLFEGGNLPGFGEAGERAGGLLGTAVGASIGAFFGGPGGARIGSMLGEAAGGALVSAVQFLYEGAQIQGARRAPQIHAGMIPDDMSPRQFAVEGAEYRAHLAQLEQQLGITAKTLDAAMTSVSQLGVAQDQEGRALTARILSLSTYLNLNEATGLQLASRMVKEYGQSITDVIPELTTLNTYTQEWNSILGQSENATARAFKSAMTLNEALSQISAGARQSGASMSDLRATAQAMLLMLGQMSRPEIAAPGAASILQAITPSASVTEAGGEYKKSFTLKTIIDQTAAGRQFSEALFKRHQENPELLGLPPGTPLSREVFEGMFNQALVNANLEAASGRAIGGVDGRMQSALMQAGLLEMIGDRVPSSGDTMNAVEQVAAQLGIGGGAADRGALFRMYQGFVDPKGKFKGNIEEFLKYMQSPGRTAREAAGALGLEEGDLMSQAEARGEATVGLWKEATARLTEWTAGLAKWWNQFGAAASEELAVMSGLTPPEDVFKEPVDEATKTAYENVGQVMETLKNATETATVPTIAEQRAGMSMPEEKGRIQVPAKKSREMPFFWDEGAEAARGEESVRRHGVSTVGGSSQHP